MLAKIRHYFSVLSFSDFARKVFFFLVQRRNSNLARKVKAWYFFKSNSLVLGKGVRIHGLPVQVSIGQQAQFYDHCVFEFGSDSSLQVGANVVLSYGVLVSCRKQIVIGKDVQIGEYSSLRDSTHAYEGKEQSMKYGQDIVDPIVIHDNVWIGRGCLIMPGTVIEEGVVVAANSVVKGHLEKDSIYGGCPARFIKKR